MFDSSLNLLDEYSVSGSRLRVGAINDLNGDGNLDILVGKLGVKDLVALDSNLLELWNINSSSSIRDIFPSDVNGDGINEILVQTSNRLYVFEYGICLDADNDSFYSQTGCDTEVDCNDTNPKVYPGARESKKNECGDGIDNDCDGLIDCDDPLCTSHKWCR